MAGLLLPIELHLSSERSRRPNTYYNDCTFDDLNISAPYGYGLYCSVVSLTIPHTFMPVNSSCNVLVLNGVAYTLEEGTYTQVQLAAALAALLPCSVTYSKITMKVTLSSSTSMTVTGTLCSVLGIPEGSSGLSISSTHCVDLSGVNSIYLLTDTYTTQNLDTRAGNSSVICRVPVQEPGSLISYTPIAEPGFWIQSGELQGIRLMLQDNRALPLQAAQPWELTLRLSYLANGLNMERREVPEGLVANYV